MKKKNRLKIENYDLYLMLVPGVVFFLVLSYLPMLWLVVAFQDYKISSGIFGSPFVGFDNFKELFQSSSFYDILKNTLLINSYKLFFGFPFPILLALAINELRIIYAKKFIQSVIYIPHFLSWVVVASLMSNVFSLHNGVLNKLLAYIGIEPIAFIVDSSFFRSLLVVTDIWKEAGWGTILYLAALAGIDPHLYEAAKIDGASKLNQIRYITLPGIQSTVILLLILSMGNLITGDFEQILMFYSPAVYNVADVIQTYVYREGIGKLDFSYTATVGLFQSVVAFILVYSANKLAKRSGGAIW